MVRMRFTLTAFVLPFFFPLFTAAAQCCGDCNDNGVVTIDEILKTVDNALDGCSIVSTPVGGSTRTPTPAPSPTALPDQCATDLPGTRLTVLGTDYIVVEVEVVLANSSDTYLLRYPAPLDSDGDLYAVSNPIYLQQKCYGPPAVCAASGDQWGSICGFSTVFNNYTSTGTSYSVGYSGNPTWTSSVSPFRKVSIILDAAHQPITLSLGIYSHLSATMNVPDISSFGYSFANANFPEPSAAELAQLQAQANSLSTHVSLRRAPLPTPPTFPPILTPTRVPTQPPTPTSLPCFKQGADCERCWDSCCSPLECVYKTATDTYQCAPPPPTPTSPRGTPTPPCP